MPASEMHGLVANDTQDVVQSCLGRDLQRRAGGSAGYFELSWVLC